MALCLGAGLGHGRTPLAESLLSPKVAFNLGGKTEQDPCVKYDNKKKMSGSKERAKTKKKNCQCFLTLSVSFEC